MINQLSSRNVRYINAKTTQLSFRPMELTFQTIELPHIMSMKSYEVYGLAIRRSLQD